MIKNLLLVAFRNLRRDKWYSLINILGLTIGLTFSLFLIFYILDELSYDRYHQNADRIYRVVAYVQELDRPVNHNASTQFPLIPEIRKDYPEVEQAVRIAGVGRTLYKNAKVQSYVDRVYLGDSNLFQVFTYQFIEGNPKTALVEPNSIVLTESVAKKYFGTVDGLIGKTLQNDKNEVYKITAVIKDVPKNSHLTFNLLISFSTLPKAYGNNWGGFGTYSYVLLKPKTNIAALEHKMLALYKNFMAPIFEEYNVKIHYGLQPITAIHLYSDMVNEPGEVGSMSYIYIFSAVALFMLLIACINYMNLTTARSARRAKEIGVRKVNGSSKSQLVMQFLVESGITTLVALVLSFILISILLPTFNLLSGKDIQTNILFQSNTWLILLGMILFVGLLSGSYPAFYLSRLKPVSVLKGNLAKSSSNATLRRVLVVVQFSISMIMLTCTWIVYGQLKYLRNKDLGFNKNAVLSLTADANYNINSKVLAFTNELKETPGIQSVSTSQNVPGGQRYNFFLLSIETKDGFTQKGVSIYSIDENFFKTMGMKMKQGRNFLGPADTLRSIIVNEAMVKEYGWDNPIGKKVKYPGDTSGFYFEVVGVVKDFNQAALYNPVAPLILAYRPINTGIQIKLDPRQISSTLPIIEKTWKTDFPDLPFSYSFLDQDFDSQYSADQKRSKIFTAFSFLTIVITCLGLLGLIAFITEQRRKEISIRKVLGARIDQIIPLLTRNFIYLIGLSCLIAFPVAAFFMDKWLHLFYYNTGLTATPFLLSALAILLIASLTVVFHSFRAARANPVNGLRTE
jgi:putative ABC transport system permease protein